MKITRINEAYYHDIDDEDDDEVDYGRRLQKRATENRKYEHLISLYDDRTYIRSSQFKCSLLRSRIEESMKLLEMPLLGNEYYIDFLIDGISYNDADKNDDIITATLFRAYKIELVLKIDCRRMQFELLTQIIEIMKEIYCECALVGKIDVHGNAFTVNIDDEVNVKIGQKPLTYTLKKEVQDMKFIKMPKHKADEIKKPTSTMKIPHSFGDAKLSDESEKMLQQFNVFDVLYSTKDGKLVSQRVNEDGSKNIPIAICIHSDYNDYRFIGLEYLTLAHVGEGTSFVNTDCVIPFGSAGSEIRAYHACGTRVHGMNSLNRDLDFRKSSHITGEIDTRKILDHMCDSYNKKGKKGREELWDIYSSENYPHENKNGSWPVVWLCYNYKTIGTEKGMWYIPAPSELHLAFGREFIKNNIPYDIETKLTVNGTPMLKGKQIIDHIRETLSEEPICTKYFCHTSLEENKNNTVSYSISTDSLHELHKSREAAIVIPFIRLSI